MHLAEKSGLLGLLAPQKDKQGGTTDEAASSTSTSTSTATSAATIAFTAEQKQQQEIERKKCLLQSQKEREIQAAAQTELGSFVKNQRARYFHKLSEQWYNDAHIVGVHHDDGVDQPYYTIRYRKPEEIESIEKQTTRDRLEYAEWEEEKTWTILSKKV